MKKIWSKTLLPGNVNTIHEIKIWQIITRHCPFIEESKYIVFSFVLITVAGVTKNGQRWQRNSIFKISPNKKMCTKLIEIREKNVSRKKLVNS